jgi:dihydropteroate synthase
VAAGAGLINDPYALRRDDALETAAQLRVPVCLMHMQGTPQDMQGDPQYDDVVAEVHSFFTQRIFACEMAGMSKKQLLVDPGFGFGKSLEHNLKLLRQLARFAELGVPVLAGLSRKGMIGALTGREVAQRVHGSVAAALLAAQNGAAIVRVHDVAATVDALAVLQAVAAQPGAPARAATPAMPRWGDED